jgi:hypothetical protein
LEIKKKGGKKDQIQRPNLKPPNSNGGGKIATLCATTDPIRSRSYSRPSYLILANIKIEREREREKIIEKEREGENREQYHSFLWVRCQKKSCY